MFHSDNATEDMSRLTEIMDALDAVSKNTSVPYNIRLAAENTNSVIKLVQESNITDGKFIQLVNRAASTVVDAYEQCKRMTSEPGSVLPQTISDDARKLANVLNSMEQQYTQLSKKKLEPTNDETEFVNRINGELDNLFQPNAHVLDTDPSTGNTKGSSNPRIVTKGDDLAMVVNSGVDRNTCTIVDASGNRTIIPGSFPNSATNAPESGTSRVVASADRVIVLDSGNNENVTMYLPAGSANIPMQDSRRALSEQALTVFSQLVLASEGPDERAAPRKVGSTKHKSRS